MSSSVPPESAPAPTGRTAPPGATPIEIARADPNAPRLRVPGDALFRAGTVVGDRYKVEQLLGRGGFGDVYRAVHIGTHEPVALKVLRPDLVAEAKAAERFTSEARLSASLKHPNTVRVFDFGQTPDGLLYLAMEFLEGKSLEEILQADGHLPPERSVRLTVQILKSLAEAHGKRIVHRDLKPDNIFVGNLAGEDDFVRVIDFGIAKFLAEGASAVITQ
ncbi:MAG: serine/threonine protein kinase, partial [Deltaproteobacteria bacterium]|nr:serine/threonine protein kinase [Deltaproteobacteria bacterium]